MSMFVPVSRRCWLATVIFLACSGSVFAEAGKLEVIRDTWGVPHVFAERESDGFFGLGHASAEDRLLQMELMRRRAHGRLAEVFGPDWVESDRKFRIAGINRHCGEAFARLPADMQDALRAYAAGVNAYVQANPEKVKRRFAPLGVMPERWTPADCLAAWLALGELFDGWIKEPAIDMYLEFQKLATELGEDKALRHRGMVLDDAAAIVSEAEMARNKDVYARLKAAERTPGFWLRGAPQEPVKFSQAWAVNGKRSTTGKPILQSDPQVPISNPPLWYEFHLSAGRYDVRGIGPAGCPALLVGWNRDVAWGATALGGGCTVTFLDKLTSDGGYEFQGKAVPFERRYEKIEVKGGEPVVQEVLTNRHGFVFNSLARESRAGHAYVGHFRAAAEQGTSVRAMLQWMRAKNWQEFRDAMQHYYSPGIHLHYADRNDNIAYQTLVHIPRTRRTMRMALEGWTGKDEVTGRIPLDEMPNMLNPTANYISHANNLPAGSWYPHDLGLAKGGIGDSVRSMRLRQLLTGDRKFSLDDFESLIHRDDVNPAVAALLPVARKVAEEDKVADPAVQKALASLKDWNLHYHTSQPGYSMAVVLADTMTATFRKSGLQDKLGGGESGVCHLARLLGERFAKDGATPRDPAVRAYLIAWLRQTGESADKAASVALAHAMPYQGGGPLRFPSLDAKRDLTSPKMTCGLVGTIWSQTGNSYTQIVDLSDVDRSRSVLPPGVSEDPESPYHAAQLPIWAKGTTHAAPLSRKQVEVVSAARITLTATAYDGPLNSPERTVAAGGHRVIAAIPAGK